MTNHSTRISGEEARRSRLEIFEPSMWLRSVRLAEEEIRYGSAQATAACPHAHADFKFEPPKLFLPKVSNFVSEQCFEGVVISVDMEAKTFWARLVDRTADIPDEEAEFSQDEISPDDRPLIVPGALFSWNIGQAWRDRQTQRVSEIRFRRFSQFTNTAIARAAQRADALALLISESDALPTTHTAEAK